MANKAVFLDRDNTIIEDPGYLTDPDAIRLLPGAELALKSFMQAGYKTVVVSNQSGIARGLLTEEQLKAIHDRLLEMLAAKGARLDEICYCPYHPDGSVERYAIESDLRKPRPGMLLRAAREMEIDLTASWMIGDSPRDIEAGQRAGCRTIRVRAPHGTHPGEASDEDVQADYTVRNLVEAARVILRTEGYRHAADEPRSSADTGEWPSPAGPVSQPEQSAYTAPVPAAVAEGPPARQTYAPAEAPPLAESLEPSQAAEPAAPAEPERAAEGRAPSPDSVRLAILQQVRQMVRSRDEVEEFAVTKLIGAILQMLALLALIVTVASMVRKPVDLAQAQMWALIGILLQLMSLTFFMMRRKT